MTERLRSERMIDLFNRVSILEGQIRQTASRGRFSVQYTPATDSLMLADYMLEIARELVVMARESEPPVPREGGIWEEGMDLPDGSIIESGAEAMRLTDGRWGELKLLPEDLRRARGEWRVVRLGASR